MTRKIITTLAALALIVSAQAKEKEGIKWDRDGDKGERGEHGNPPVSAVPEPNTTWVLLPFVGAVLLFSALRLRKATQ